MAKGSHQTYGGWEPRACSHCGTPLPKNRTHAWHAFNHETGLATTYCTDHFHHYPESLGGGADRIHPDQLELEDAL